MIQVIDRGAVRELMAFDAQIIEVLEPSEYRKAHLPGAINIPLWEIGQRAGEELDRGQPIVCNDLQ